ALAKIPLQGTLVLTCEDGVLAGRAAAEAHALVDRPVRALEGGNAAWLAAGHALTADAAKMADEGVDARLKPQARAGAKARATRREAGAQAVLVAGCGAPPRPPRRGGPRYSH